jgi:hypothetical protein
MLSKALFLASVLPLSSAAETVLGVYIFSRHGDRTPKALPPAYLTDLGYSEIYTSGQYYRNRYISSNATSQIHGINSDIVKLSQLAVTSPVDNVLQNSAVGFLQALYPPVGPTLNTETLRDGRTVSSPMNGYQIIPVNTVASGTASEDSAWLQGQTNCANALVSSNNYYFSSEYMTLLSEKQDFYNTLKPMVNRTFTDVQTTYKNAYTSKSYHR